MRDRYEAQRGGLSRVIAGLLLAVTLGGAAFIGGKYGAQQFCEGPCGPTAPLADLLALPFDFYGVSTSWLMIAVAASGLLLWLALSIAPAQTGLAFISLLVLALLGSLFENEPAVPEPEVEPVEETISLPAEIEPSLVQEEPAPELIAEPSIPECPQGLYWNGEGCMSCTVQDTVVQKPKLFFSALTFQSAWQYANDRSYVHMGGHQGVTYHLSDLAIDGNVSAGGQALCASRAILVVGSASSDGPAARNERRAAKRAQHLANRVNASCPGEVEVYSMTLGQSSAGTDSELDRALTVIGLDAPLETDINEEVIASELGHLLFEQQLSTPLFERYENFPPDQWKWSGENSSPVNVSVAPRAYESVDRLRDNAPEACQSMR